MYGPQVGSSPIASGPFLCPILILAQHLTLEVCGPEFQGYHCQEVPESTNLPTAKSRKMPTVYQPMGDVAQRIERLKTPSPSLAPTGPLVEGYRLKSGRSEVRILPSSTSQNGRGCSVVAARRASSSPTTCLMGRLVMFIGTRKRRFDSSHPPKGRMQNAECKMQNAE